MCCSFPKFTYRSVHDPSGSVCSTRELKCGNTRYMSVARLVVVPNDLLTRYKYGVEKGVERHQPQYDVRYMELKLSRRPLMFEESSGSWTTSRQRLREDDDVGVKKGLVWMLPCSNYHFLRRMRLQDCCGMWARI